METKTLDNKGITGSTLKLIAIITMLIDHIAAVILDAYLMKIGFYDQMQSMFILPEGQTAFAKMLYLIYITMRLIGRVAFPIFCFLLIEGFCYTRNRAKYAFRLFLFALISEIPFDLALGKTSTFLPEFTYQNVYFTLLFGLLTIWGMDRFSKWYTRVPIAIVGIVIAELAHTDYGAIGVITIVLIYLFKKKSNVKAILAGCVALTINQFIEGTCLIDIWLVSKYNGQRGLKLKYVFYLFYPVHLFILYLIKVALVG